MAGDPDEPWSDTESTSQTGTSTGKVNVQDFLQLLLSHNHQVKGKVSSDGTVEYEFRTRSSPSGECACSGLNKLCGGGSNDPSLHSYRQNKGEVLSLRSSPPPYNESLASADVHPSNRSGRQRRRSSASTSGLGQGRLHDMLSRYQPTPR
jgi:hypothetical protein